MKQRKEQILFIQGGGEEGYEADKKLVESLKTDLGSGFDIHYPEIKPDHSAPDFGWLNQIEVEISGMPDPFILVAHSFGASMVLKFLSENSTTKSIEGVFLISIPFWEGGEDWKQGIKLAVGFEDQLPKSVPLFFYHANDDEEVPLSHFEQYRKKIPQAVFRNKKRGGHQLGNDLSIVATDILELYKLPGS